jgi:hypothetical protein
LDYHLFPGLKKTIEREVGWAKYLSALRYLPSFDDLEINTLQTLTIMGRTLLHRQIKTLQTLTIMGRTLLHRQINTLQTLTIMGRTLLHRQILQPEIIYRYWKMTR